MRNFLKERQRELRGKRECMASLLDFFKRVNTGLDNRGVGGWCGLNYLQSLDTVSHRTMINELPKRIKKDTYQRCPLILD